MMNEIEQKTGLTHTHYDELSPDGKALYNMLYDYCTYSNDPQYKTLHKFRNKISKLKGRDRELLIEYFNHDPAINWNGISCKPWEYYKDPY
jgi:hypothetical protein